MIINFLNKDHCPNTDLCDNSTLYKVIIIDQRSPKYRVVNLI